MLTRADIDWRELRGALAALIASLLFGASLLAASHYFESRMQAQYQVQKRLLDVVRGNYYAVDEEERLIESFLPQYVALQNEGIVGAEQRLSWVEALGDASARIKLPSLSYEISSREAYKPEFPLDTGAFRVYATEMRLRVGLLHEGDLPALLHALDRAATGLYTVDHCSVSRNSEEFRLSPAAENLTAQCSLRWFTIAAPGAVESGT
jgi:hypothetical protein